MKIKYLRDECYDELENSIKKNYDKYCLDTPWLLDMYKDIKCYNESSIEILKAILNNDSKNDFENAKALYESLKNLTPFQATNIYLWTYLTHVTYYEYMTKRWKINSNEQDKQSITRIKERYFCRKSRRGLLRNGISRLWWATYLSYDEDENDHYMYTKILFTEEELFTGLLERDFSMNKNIVKGVLKCFKDYIDVVGTLPTRELRRNLMKYINYQGAIVMYDILDETDIYNLVRQYIKKYDVENGDKI